MAKKKAASKSAAAKKVSKKKPAAAKKKAVKKATKKKSTGGATSKKVPRKKAAKAGKETAPKPAKTAARKAAAKKTPTKTVRKKGVRRATMTTGIKSKKADKNIGRSRIPMDAPLAVVFEHFPDAQRAFELLQIHTIRELEEFEPDELVRRLTSPAKQTVGRIRKILAMNNRCLANDESFAIEFQDRVASRRSEG